MPTAVTLCTAAPDVQAGSLVAVAPLAALALMMEHEGEEQGMHRYISSRELGTFRTPGVLNWLQP